MKAKRLKGISVTTTLVVCVLNSPLALSQEVPTIVFTENGVYLNADPEEQARIGETLSLMEIGRRFRSCRVRSEYYQGDEEGIETKIACGDVVVSVDADEAGKIYGFWTATKGAAFANGTEIGDPVVEAVGSTAYCNLCREDQMSYCQSEQEGIIRYDVSFPQNCEPTNLDSGERCAGTHQIQACVAVVGLGHGQPDP